jgi:hypothetical protein
MVMEKFALTLQSEPVIDAYIAEHHLMLMKKRFSLKLLLQLPAATPKN